MLLEQGLRKLSRDRVNGSATLGRLALDMLASAAAAPAAGLVLPALVRRLSLVRPVLAAVGVLSREWLEELCHTLNLEPADLHGGRPLPDCAPSDVALAGETARARLLLGMDRAEAARREAGGQLIQPGMKLLVHSASSQVEDLLLSCPENAQFAFMESIPGGEGRALALRMGTAGRPVKLYHDSELGRALAEADMVLLGADAVTAPSPRRRFHPQGIPAPESGEGLAPLDLWVVNKVGSRLVAQGARSAGLPLVLVLGREKCTGDPVEPFIRGSAWDVRAFEALPVALSRYILADTGLASRSWLLRSIEADRRRWHLFMN